MDCRADHATAIEKNEFCLFTAPIANLVPRADDTTEHIQTAQARRDEHALRRLNKFQDSAFGAGVTTFMLRGPYNFATEEVWYQTLTLSSTVGAALVAFFENEATNNNKRQWDCLQIWDCTPNDALLQVLDAIGSLRIFRSFDIRRMGRSSLDILERLVKSSTKWENCYLEDLRELDSNFTTICRDLAATIDHPTLPKLKRIRMRYLSFSNPEDFEPIVEGLSKNTTLEELTIFGLSNLPHSGLADVMIALEGHSRLESLNLPRNFLVNTAFGGLGRTLSHQTCQIATLDLSQCISKTSSVLHPIHMDSLISSIRGCKSLSKLVLARNRFSSRDLQRLLAIVNTCPNLKEIDLSENRIERIVWKTDGTVIPSRSLECLLLTRNPIVYNRFRIRAARDIDMLEAMLRSFPALGRIFPDKPLNRLMPFPGKIPRLMAYNFASRGRLEGSSLGLSLWPLVLKRVGMAVQTVDILRHEESTSADGLTLSCQASLLYSLLRNHPSNAASVLHQQSPCFPSISSTDSKRRRLK